MSQIQTAESKKHTEAQTEHTVGKPKVTDHNINDEYFRHPPRNLPLEDSQPKVGGQDFGNKSERREDFINRVLPDGAMGEEINGRIKRSDVEAATADDDEAEILQ